MEADGLLGRYLKRVMGRYTPDCRYELQQNELVRFEGPTPCERLPTAEIESWTVDRGDKVDVVHIRLRDGRKVDWLDEQYDLLPLLDAAAANAHAPANVDAEEVCHPDAAPNPAQPRFGAA